MHSTRHFQSSCWAMCLFREAISPKLWLGIALAVMIAGACVVTAADQN